MTQSRFTVGNTYLFFKLVYRDTRDQSILETIMPSSPILFSYLELDKVEILELICQSQHEVPVAYSDRTATGFIFIDDEGKEYHNQYPTASYGQLSDSGDRIVHGNFGKFPELRLITSLMDDTNRFLRDTPDSALRPHVDSIINQLDSYFKANGYFHEQQVIWEAAPDITRTVIIANPVKALVNQFRGLGYTRTVYEDQIIDGKPYISYRKDFRLCELPLMCEEIGITQESAGDTKVCFEIEESGSHVQYCVMSIDFDNYERLFNPTSENKEDFKAMLTLFNEQIPELA